jgi:hypothetical protein
MSQVGDPGSSAPSSFTVNYDALLTTTLFAYRQKMVDNIFKANAFLAALKKYDGIEYQDGGERVAQPLMYEENATFDSYRGYDLLDTTPQDGMTDAFYEWSEIGGTISISRREERQNSGEARILNLLKKKIMQAEMSIKSKVNNQLVLGTVSSNTFVPGNGAKDLLPLGYFLSKDNTADPVSGGNVGNISRATYDWWRPRTAVLDSASTDTGNDFAVSVTTYAGLKVALHRMYNFCTRGADNSAPNLVLSDQVTYETYENALDEQKRYGDEGLVTMGFDNIKLKGATMIWDELVPDVDTGAAALTTGTAFFLNTQFYKLIIDEQTDFVTTPFVEPENQTAKTAKVLFMGQSAVSNYRKHGVCYAISQSITS